MKCPNCGEEIGDAKVCNYCGTTIADSKANEDVSVEIKLDKMGCPKCGSNNIQFNRENLGEIRNKKSKKIVHSTVGYCKDCGYTWYPDNDNPQKKRKTWLWVLGWLFIFPLPLTILLLRKKDMKPALKYGIIAVAWLIYIAIAFAGNSTDTNTETDKQNNKAVVEEEVDKSTSSEEEKTVAKEEETEEVDKADETEPEKEKTPEENARDMGLWWFQHIDWDNTFQYKSKVHYVTGYSCRQVPEGELREYGDYVATASADLQNGFGAEFKSTIYIFMDENGVAKHVFYDEADGSSQEIPMENIPVLSF